MDFEIIAELTRLTARLSLSLFCMAFVIDAMMGKMTRFYYGLFIAAHVVHLAMVALYFQAAGHGPEVTPALGLLGLGLVAFVWLSAAIFRGRPAPQVAAWYIWFLFGATHISRLLDPERAGAINWLLLGVVLAAGAVRIALGLAARRSL